MSSASRTWTCMNTTSIPELLSPACLIGIDQMSSSTHNHEHNRLLTIDEIDFYSDDESRSDERVGGSCCQKSSNTFLVQPRKITYRNQPALSHRRETDSGFVSNSSAYNSIVSRSSRPRHQSDAHAILVDDQDVRHPSASSDMFVNPAFESLFGIFKYYNFQKYFRFIYRFRISTDEFESN